MHTQSSLSSDQKTEVNSISGMGFPPQRVARAVLKYDSDRSKVCVCVECFVS